MKKNNMIFMLCILCISLQTICKPSFGRKKKGSLTRSDTPAAGALFSAQTRSQSELPSADHSCSAHSRTCAAALAQVQAEKADIEGIKTTIEALQKKVVALRDETAIAQHAARESATQAATSQAQTQNMTAIVMVIGAYCMYTHMKKDKKEKKEIVERYYRKMQLHFSRQVRTIKRSQKQLRSFCINCLPHTIKSYF